MYDVRYALRSLRKAPGFSLIAVITLAIGIGANTAIFSVVNAVVLRRLPFERPHELMRLYLLMPPRSPGEAPLDMFWSFPKYELLRETQDVFSDLATFRRYDYTLTGVDIPERVSGEVVGASYFDLLGVRPLIGRAFLPDEDAPGAAADVAILSYGLWRRLYNGVLSYAVAQRTHEIGLRMALGAERFTILKLVVGRALAIALVGLGVGLVTAWGLMRVLAAILYEVSANDPVTFGIVALVLAALAFVASYLPARRASRVDPLIALKHE